MNLFTFRFNPNLSSILLAVICLIIPLRVSYATAEVTEYELKAVFLYNIANFVTWPDTAFTYTDSPFRFCVFGDNPFENSLKYVVLQETVQDRTAEVVELNRHQLDDIANCHILFLSQSEHAHLRSVISHANQYPLLLVSDIENFIDHGGMVKFFMQQTRIRLAINPLAVEAVNLVMNANLLRVAKIVE